MKVSLTVNDAALNEEMCNQPAAFLFYANEYAKAEKAYEDTRIIVERVEAEAFTRIRQSLVAQGTKPSNEVVANAVKIDPTYVNAQKVLNKAKSTMQEAKNLRDAWFMRKDLLIQLAINSRTEMKSLQNTIHEN